MLSLASMFDMAGSGYDHDQLLNINENDVRFSSVFSCNY